MAKTNAAPSLLRLPRPARLPVIHVTLDEKRRFHAKATRLGWPLAELVRRGVEAFQPPEK